MNCPNCGAGESRVTVTHRYPEENKRFRHCLACGERWTTVELYGNVKVRNGEVVGVHLHGQEIAEKL